MTLSSLNEYLVQEDTDPGCLLEEKKAGTVSRSITISLRNPIATLGGFLAAVQPHWNPL